MMIDPTPNLLTSNSTPFLSDDDYVRFRNLVLERTGLYFSENKRLDLENGLLKALPGVAAGKFNNDNSLDQYFRLLSDRSSLAGQAEFTRLINLLTVGETYFFRDEGQFDALAASVLPQLIAHKRAAAAALGPQFQPQLRLWSAGCATGEEPYSLAMLLHELLPDIDRWYILILATDLNQEFLARARQGVYSEWSFRETKAKIRQSRYFSFDPAAKRYILRPDIRRMVTLAPLNLIEDEYPAIQTNTISLDLILCRNVTIYFTEAATRQVAQRFYEALNPHGWLVVGHSEPSPTTYQAFQAHTWPNAVLYQKNGQPKTWAEPEIWPWLPKTGFNLAKPLTLVERSTGAIVSSNLNGKSALAGSLPTAPMVYPPLAAETVETKNQPTSAYEAAITWLNQGRSAEAISELQRQLKQTPNMAPAYTLMGRAYANLEQWAEAEQYCRRAIELDRLQGEAYYLLGLIYQHQEQLEPAIAMLKKAVYIESEQPLTYLHLAALYKQTGQIKHAQRACRNVIKVLEKQPPADIVPHSGGATVGHLLNAARRILNQLNHH
jgi:chemotaxis protein methyltransferase CheR